MPIIAPGWRHRRPSMELAENLTNSYGFENVVHDNFVGVEAIVDQLRLGSCPVGTCVVYAGYDTPEGWFLANGAQILIDAYRDLYNKLTSFGTTFPYGANTNGSGGAGTTHFRLPTVSAYGGIKYIIKY